MCRSAGAEVKGVGFGERWGGGKTFTLVRRRNRPKGEEGPVRGV